VALDHGSGLVEQRDQRFAANLLATLPVFTVESPTMGSEGVFAAPAPLA
jgi:hypothetical protein